jgi:hypothetical protein
LVCSSDRSEELAANYLMDHDHDQEGDDFAE